MAFPANEVTMFSVGESLMGRWQSKILFSLILYGAGFVTAVYLLAPSPVQAADQTQLSELSTSSQQDSPVLASAVGINSNDWVIKVRSGIDTCIHFAEEHALRAADLIRSKMGQGKNHSSE